ncbi:cyclase family protein [Maribacter hydrothermalis]|uniref:Metal-dependent hydrolase n=1 Tax=Maribacter hydrothermalis TaxID=1836467 RepID=A0A1B7ZFK4_9FLAO|nr:cyclase family protein [Maribacter hydrothermalis]APQ17747.1 metal-dependent hydrolase [Maribacter hydrothermalis]OBR42222.1 metal-dependent hydrolase [Maribacter hydrothermalis]
MKTTITHNANQYQFDLSKPLDISIPITSKKDNVNAWYVDSPTIEPHRDKDFVGSIPAGSSTNFYDISFNPHAHGTHTECVGHISAAHQSVNQHLKQYFFLAEVITITPIEEQGDLVITKDQLQKALGNKTPMALVLRTLPNSALKRNRQYSNTNPPYILEDAMIFVREVGVEHLLIDLPSVDKEKDNGALLAHKAFWNFNGEVRLIATITEFIYVPDSIIDGSYFLNLQVAPIENDASPSRPVLYKIE